MTVLCRQFGISRKTGYKMQKDCIIELMSFLFKIICLFMLSVCVFVSYGNQKENRCKSFFSLKRKFLKLKRKAKKGDVYAQRELGQMHLYGEKVPQDLQKSFFYFQQLGKTSTQRLVRLEVDQSNPLDINTHYLRELMEESKDAELLYYGGMLFLLGVEVMRQPWYTVQLLNRSADMGYAKAQYALGEIYRDGFHVPQDYQKADDWFDQAKSQGYTGEQSSGSDISEIETIIKYVNFI